MVACGLGTRYGESLAWLGQCAGDLRGQLVNPGDIVVADDDGVVIVPREQATAIADAAQTRVDLETSKRQRLANGELGLDIYQMRAPLAKKGLRYVNSLNALKS